MPLRLSSTTEEQALGWLFVENSLSAREIRRGIAVRQQAIARRQVNVVLAWTGLFLAFPAMLAIGTIIRLLSPGPILTREPRIGLDRRLPLADKLGWRRQLDLGGSPFELYRFRTAPVSGADWLKERESLRGKLWNRFRGLLKRSHMDWLPVLFNVVKGDMNLVGPRPETPLIFAAKRANLNSYSRRQRVLPGVIGFAQIHGREISSNLETRLDLRYVDRASVTQDLRIIVLAVGRGLFRMRSRRPRV